MNLINKQVEHRIFGKGSVVELNETSIGVNFTSGLKKFIYPDAFGTFLKLTDQRAASSMKKLLNLREQEKQKQAEEQENERLAQRRRELFLQQRDELLKKMKIHPSSQAAFWCEDEEMDAVFQDWSIFAGTVKAGYYEGMAKRPVRLHQNSACLLTVRSETMAEPERRIIGFYMVNEAFTGKMCEDGYVSAHSKYRLRLSEEEASKLLFWNYYINEKHPQSITWNSGKYRYFDNIWMAQILRDAAAMKKGTPDAELAQEFYNYFCDINRINTDEIPAPAGALIQTEAEKAG